MPTVYTIGYKGKPLKTLINQLRDAGIDAVIDVRLRNTSHLAGYTKRDDLAFLLEEGFQIAYEHRPELAPPPKILDAYRENEDWAAYESLFAPLLAQRDAGQVGMEVLSRYRAPCLLCSERTAEHCHRRLIVEHWVSVLPQVRIVHL